MTWRRIILWSAGGLIVLLGLTVTWLLTADLGVFKPRIEQFVSEKVGRAFSIDGELDILLGNEIVVAANDLRLANADWAEEPLMVDVGRLELRVDARSLFGGPVKIDLVRIADSKIRLTESVNGRNWELAGGSRDTEDDQGPARSWLLRHVDVSNTRVVYETPGRPEPVDLRVAQLLQKHGSDDFLDIEVDATLADRSIAARARVGTWSNLLARKDVDAELSAEIDTLSVSGTGHIDDLASPRRPQLEFEARGPDLNDVARMLGIEQEYRGDINLTVSLDPTDGGPLVLGIDGNLGQMQIGAEGAFSDLQSLEQSSLDLAVSGPDLNRILRLAGAPSIRSAPYEVELSAQRDGSRLVVQNAHMSFADAEFNLTAELPRFPTLDDAELRLTITGDDFERFREITRLPGAATGPYSLEFELDDSPDGTGRLRLDAQSTLMSASAEGSVGASPDYLGSRLGFRINAENLASIGDAYRVTGLPDRPLSVSGEISVVEAGIRTSAPVTLSSNDITASIEGLLTLAPNFNGSDFTFSAGGPELSAALAGFVASDRVPPMAFSVDGGVRFVDAGYRLREITARVGRASLVVDGVIAQAPGMAGTELEIRSESPALEELLSGFPGLSINPGPASLSARVAFTNEALRLENIDLSRSRGRLTGNVEIALPFSERSTVFAFRARGDDLRAVAGSVYGFEPAPSAFAVTARGSRRAAVVILGELDAEFGRASLEASGRFDADDPTGDTRVNASIRVPDLAELGLLNGRRFNEQAFEFSARAVSNGNSVSVDNMVTRIGGSDVRGTIKLEGGDVPRLSVSIDSDALRYAPLLEPVEAEYDTAPELEDGRLIPDWPVPFEQMKRIDAVVDVDIGELKRGDFRITDLDIGAELEDGAFRLPRLGFRGAKGWFQARASLQPGEGTGSASLAVAARDFSVAYAGLNQDLSGSGSMDANMEATGNDLRALAGSANGVALARVNNLTFTDSSFLKRLYGDLLTEIVDMINPFAKTSPRRHLDCVIMPLEISDGMLRTSPSLLIRTDKLRIVSEASINLKNEKLEMQFNSTPRSGITISAGELLNPYVKVTGTLGRPRLAVDQQGILLTGGAAVATGGISILAKAAWQRLSRDADPCATAESLGMEALGDRFAEFEPPRPNPIASRE